MKSKWHHRSWYHRHNVAKLWHHHVAEAEGTSGALCTNPHSKQVQHGLGCSGLCPAEVGLSPRIGRCPRVSPSLFWKHFSKYLIDGEATCICDLCPISGQLRGASWSPLDHPRSYLEEATCLLPCWASRTWHIIVIENNKSSVGWMMQTWPSSWTLGTDVFFHPFSACWSFGPLMH